MITTCTNNHSIEASWKTLVLLLSGPKQSQLQGLKLSQGWSWKRGLPTKKKRWGTRKLSESYSRMKSWDTGLLLGLGLDPWVFWEGDHITRPKSSDDEGHFFDFKLWSADIFLICLALRELFDQRGWVDTHFFQILIGWGVRSCGCTHAGTLNNICRFICLWCEGRQGDWGSNDDGMQIHLMLIIAIAHVCWIVAETQLKSTILKLRSI